MVEYLEYKIEVENASGGTVLVDKKIPVRVSFRTIRDYTSYINKQNLQEEGFGMYEIMLWFAYQEGCRKLRKTVELKQDDMIDILDYKEDMLAEFITIWYDAQTKMMGNVQKKMINQKKQSKIQ